MKTVYGLGSGSPFGLKSIGQGYKKRKWVYGNDIRIEARDLKLEVRVSSIHMRDSIRASTTINVNFNLTKRASLPLPLDETLVS